jgi:hypothetical protein
MASPDTQEALVRIVLGALIGLLVGLLIVVGTASYYANSIGTLWGIVVASIAICASLAWLIGNRFIQSVHKWIQWFQ